MFFTTITPFFRGIGANIETLPVKANYLNAVYETTSNLHLTSPYGLFRRYPYNLLLLKLYRMTGVGGRPELIIEGVF